MVKVWIAMFCLLVMIFVVGYQHDELKGTQNALVLLAAEETKDKKLNKGLTVIEMPDFELSDGHMDGIRIDWTSMSFWDFTEKHPDSHFLHMQFKDVVLTIDWEHAKVSPSSEYIQHLFRSWQAEQGPE